MRGRPGIHAVGRYGVYLCPECGEAFSKEAKVRRTRCPRCGKGVDVQKLFALYRTDDVQKAAEGVRYANLAGHRKGEAPSAHRDIESAFAKETRAKHDYAAFAMAIEEMQGTITRQRLGRELKGFKREKLDAYLERAIEEGLLVRCRGGYRAVQA